MPDTPNDLDRLLSADPRDPGCDAGVPLLDQFVELELAGQDASATFPGTAAHLRSCPACRADHDGLLEMARELGEATPPD
jgi:predicted anti-sigma-YlaC factor YlaD